MSAPEPALLRRGLAATERCAARLERSLRRLHTILPIDPADLPALDARQQDDIDAFLKRFEQLVLTLPDQVSSAWQSERAKIYASGRAATWPS